MNVNVNLMMYFNCAWPAQGELNKVEQKLLHIITHLFKVIDLTARVDATAIN